MEFDLSRVSIETRRNIGNEIYKIILEAVKTDPYLCELVEERYRKYWDGYINYQEEYLGIDLSDRDDIDLQKANEYKRALESVVDELTESIKK